MLRWLMGGAWLPIGAALAGGLLVSGAWAQTPKPSRESGRFDCTGPFAKASSHQEVVRAFGTRNVVHKTVPGPEGTSHKATVVFDKDPARRLEIVWRNEKARTGPAHVLVSVGARWRTPWGIGIGSTLEEVERANGRPFVLSGFGWDCSGTVTDWKSGRLGEGECRLLIRFEPSDGAYDEKLEGDRDVASDDPALRKARPTVHEMGLMWQD